MKHAVYIVHTFYLRTTVCALPSEFFEFSWLMNNQFVPICCLWIREYCNTFRVSGNITFLD